MVGRHAVSLQILVFKLYQLVACFGNLKSLYRECLLVVPLPFHWEVIFVFQYSSELPTIILCGFSKRGVKMQWTLIYATLHQEPTKFLLKGKNMFQATPGSMESFAGNLGGYTVPSIILLWYYWYCFRVCTSTIPGKEAGFCLLPQCGWQKGHCWHHGRMWLAHTGVLGERCLLRGSGATDVFKSWSVIQPLPTDSLLLLLQACPIFVHGFGPKTQSI